MMHAPLQIKESVVIVTWVWENGTLPQVKSFLGVANSLNSINTGSHIGDVSVLNMDLFAWPVTLHYGFYKLMMQIGLGLGSTK